ncbi:uncharacterized protein LOC111891525 isoform X3 [Lactuca sativa]|uniref:uncharacterized protein LOC111891525 isoform X3 n=1 Tax=Lactuca sativa TaxID=4236 RepID=UPI001C687371|nr:uncharacterized protein LOC111891525 isoform X3 [Lactuca sativa]
MRHTALFFTKCRWMSVLLTSPPYPFGLHAFRRRSIHRYADFRELEKLACSHCYSQIQVPNTYIIFILKTCILLVASVEGSVSLEAI